MRISPNLGSALTPSPTLHINERVNELWRRGETVYHLGFGESRFPAHPRLVRALAENAWRSSYLPAAGIPELREAAAHYYAKRLGLPLTAQQVLAGPGSKALLYALLMALDGDLILPTPCWVSYGPQARLLGKPVRRIPADPADHHRLDPENLERTIAASPAGQHVLILNSPNNPSGQMFTRSEMEAVARICRASNTLVCSDELYGLITHHDQPHHSPSEFYPEGTIVLSGLSKHLSLGGWRLGVALLPQGSTGETLAAALVKIGSEIWSCAAAPVQYAAVHAYSEDREIENYIGECARIHALRTHYLWRELGELDIDCAEPQGGFYLFPNFDRWRPALAARGIQTSDELAAHLLDAWQIATLPGSVFGTPPAELSLRLSSSYVDMESEEKAQAILDRFRNGEDADGILRRHHPNLNRALEQIGRFLAGIQDG